ncbi:MAG: DUF4266 domain-containing protein [Gammaproteobacteria bacterium]
MRRLVGGCVVACLLGGCAVTPVQSWEKGALARAEMRLSGGVLETAFDEHIYASREAASGGSGVGGGGCGCN